MPIDTHAAATFVTTNARLLDRQRLRLVLGNGEPAAALSALEAYRNDDGGYGWGLEPDLRAPESQPGGGLHAFEVFEGIAPVTSGRAEELCTWLQSVTLPDGGLPFALPIADAAGCAPFWAQADATASSLHITSAVTAAAHRVARHDAAVRAHPWLARATGYCMDRIASSPAAASTLELLYVLQLLDALHDDLPEADVHLRRLGAAIPPSGSLRVEGGAEDEMIRPLDFAPRPGRPVRMLFRPEVVAADLDRLRALQQAHGGWEVDFQSYSPSAALEWNGYATVRAIETLQANDRLG